MTPADPGFRKCYKHPARVAIRDCRICGRPICKEDEAECGEPDLCLLCKQDVLLHGEQQLERTRKQERKTPFVVSEVTVLDDGTVVRPEQLSPEESVREGEETPGLAAYVEEAEPVVPLAGVPVGTPPSVLQEFEAPPLVVPGEEIKAVRAVESPAPAREPGVKTGPWNQALYAARYGVGIAALVSGAWMLIALFSKQWTQVSVFTLGIAVPWAIFNATTRKKYMGVRVWMEPPPTIFVSLASFSVTVVFAALMEYLARLIIFGSRFPVSDFMQRYFKTTDLLVVACALAVSFLAPYLLMVGAKRSKPSASRSGKGGLPQAEAEELRKALEAEARKESGELGGEQEPPTGIE